MAKTAVPLLGYNSTSNSNPLLLPDGQQKTTLAHIGIVSFRQLVDESVGIAHNTGLDHEIPFNFLGGMFLRRTDQSMANLHRQ